MHQYIQLSKKFYLIQNLFFGGLSDENSGNCLTGYTKLTHGCYQDTRFSLNLNIGAHICNNKGGHVLVVESDQEQDEVISEFNITSECRFASSIFLDCLSAFDY